LLYQESSGKKKNKQNARVAREEENVIPYVALMFITVRQRLVRKRKGKKDKRFCSNDMKKQKQCTCAR
jgi:hypothetical protein